MEPQLQEQIPSPVEPEETDLPAQSPAVSEVSAEEPTPQVDVTGRLAADFIRLTEEFPDLLSPSQLPEEVLEAAAAEDIPLLDAYLRYRWQEEKKVLAAAAKRQQAARQSAGSLSASAAQVNPEQDAFLRAFRRAL